MANKLRKEILAPFTGVWFEIRRVSLSEYLQEMKDLPFSLAPATQEELQKLKDGMDKLSPEEQRAANDKATNLFLRQGIVRLKYPGEDWIKPNIWYGNEDECPADHVLVKDFATDAALLVQEIANYSFNILGGQPIEGFFPKSKLSGPGPSGEEVRAETVDAPPDRSAA